MSSNVLLDDDDEPDQTVPLSSSLPAEPAGTSSAAVPKKKKKKKTVERDEAADDGAPSSADPPARERKPRKGKASSSSAHESVGLTSGDEASAADDVAAARPKKARRRKSTDLVDSSAAAAAAAAAAVAAEAALDQHDQRPLSPLSPIVITPVSSDEPLLPAPGNPPAATLSVSNGDVKKAPSFPKEFVREPAANRSRLTTMRGEFTHYFRQSYIENSRNKCQYLLGCTSVFLVVVIVSVAMSTIFYSPVLFLGLAEASSGEIDLQISSGQSGFAGLNYTLVRQVLAASDEGDAASYNSFRDVTGVNVFAEDYCDGSYSHASPTDMQWSYSGTTNPNAEANCITGDPAHCLMYHCANEFQATFVLLDTNREAYMQLGRGWGLPPVPFGSCYVQTNLARSLNVNEGDTIFVSLQLNQTDGYMFFLLQSGYNASAPGDRLGVVNIPLVIDTIIPTSTSKFPSSMSNVIMMEYTSLPAMLAESLNRQNPQFTPAFLSNLSTVDMLQGVHQVLFNLPAPRFSWYDSSIYNVNAQRVITWSSTLVFTLGFEQLSSSLPVLSALKVSNFASAFLGLVLNIIIILLSGISLLLIYSLLMISVEARTFEMAIFRMVGLQRSGLVQMLLVHAWVLAVPAWAIGLIVAQGLFFYVADELASLTYITVSPLLSGASIGVATTLGLVLPILAATLPIRTALAKNLHDSLDNNRSKVKAVEITVERAASDRYGGLFFLTGALLTAFGFMIYYFLPLALVNGDLTSLFNIFLIIILGMMLGLVLLALNLQPLLERLLAAIVFFVFFFENRAVPDIVAKNLMSHRLRNKKTAITYSLSLGFIIFLSVAVDVEIQSLKFQAYDDTGGPLAIFNYQTDSSGHPISINNLKLLETWALNNSLVVDFSYATYPLQVSSPLRTGTAVTTFGQYVSEGNNVYGASSNIFETLMADFYAEGLVNASSPYTVSQQMYTPQGSFGLVVGTNLKTDLDLTTLQTKFLYTVTTATHPRTRITNTVVVPTALLSGAAWFSITYFDNGGGDAVTNFPLFVELSEGQYESVNDLPIRAMFIKPIDGITDAQMDQLVRSIPILTDGYVNDARDNFAGFVNQQDTIQWIFQVVTLFTMIIAFFSLNTSMYTNIVEQSKEIGILRALGVTQYAIFRIYTYESMFLVLTSAFLGSLIGLLIGWSISAQRALFTQIPLSFEYPWTLAITITAVAFICGLLSTITPVIRLVRKPVIGTLRS